MERLIAYRAEEWDAEPDWWAAREAWEAAGGVLPIDGPEDVEHTAAWAWRPGDWSDPDEWRAALRTWEDEHGRLRISPDAPFEPRGRGLYDYRTGQWEQ